MKSLQELLAPHVKQLSLIPDVAIADITNDSRSVSKNSLFLAFPGEKTDGRQYIAQAIEKGAAAICYEAASHQPITQTSAIPHIPISHLKQAQADLAAQFYDFPGKKLKMVGVTGTNGKSSVTHYIAQALSDTQCCGVIGTLGYGILPHLMKTKNTTSDALQLQKQLFELNHRGATIVVAEVSSHGLVENRIQHILFDTAVFTNLTQDHLDFHGTMENYRAAKELLFQLPDLKNAVINLDDAAGKYFFEQYKHQLSIVTFSMQKNAAADIILEHSQVASSGFDLTIKSIWGRGSLHCPLLGKFNIQNVLAVLGVLGVLGVPLSTILKQLSQLHNITGRMQLYQLQHTPRVIVDFAHTPDALQNVLHTLHEHCDGKLWCVLGCGGERDRGKRPKMGSIAEQFCDRIIITNDNPRSESPEKIAADIVDGIVNRSRVLVELDRSKAIATAIQEAALDDVILVAGKGHETEQILHNQILHFNDGDEVMLQLKCRHQSLHS